MCPAFISTGHIRNDHPDSWERERKRPDLASSPFIRQNSLTLTTGREPSTKPLPSITDSPPEPSTPCGQTAPCESRPVPG